MSSWPISTPASSVPTTLPSLKDADAQPADDEADGQRQEDRQLGIVAQRLDRSAIGSLLSRRPASATACRPRRTRRRLNAVVIAPSRYSSPCDRKPLPANSRFALDPCGVIAGEEVGGEQQQEREDRRRHAELARRRRGTRRRAPAGAPSGSRTDSAAARRRRRA